MIKPFEFYFDFASPYTFVAHKKIRKIEKRDVVAGFAGSTADALTLFENDDFLMPK